MCWCLCVRVCGQVNSEMRRGHEFQGQQPRIADGGRRDPRIMPLPSMQATLLHSSVKESTADCSTPLHSRKDIPFGEKSSGHTLPLRFYFVGVSRPWLDLFLQLS